MKLQFWNKKAVQFQVENVPSVTPAIRRPSSIEIGATGQSIFGGRLSTTDYNPELQPPYMYDIYDRMRKSDGTIKGLLNAIKLPLKNVDWRIVPASKDEQDIAIADWLQNEFQNMTISVDSLIHHILLHLDFGCMPFESVWELTPDNLVTLRKLAPRMPSTIQEWSVDNHGGLKGVTQYGYSASGFTPVEIPVEKLLVFVNEQEGSDFRGTSVLRPCYKHWYMKDKFYILDAIAKERRSVGVDVGTLEGDIREGDQEDLEMALMGLHAHEKQFLIEQKEHHTYRIEGLQGRPLPILDSIEHHDKQILRTLLAEFISLGGSGGSFALSRDKSSFFTLALNSIAKNIAGTFNRHLLKRWVDYNWTVDKYPMLTYSRIETRDVEALANSIKSLEESGFISPVSADEDALRDALELPNVRREKEVTGIPINGAQLSSITTLFQRIGEGLISPLQAKGILLASFPFLTEEQIDAMIGAEIDG